MKLEHQLLYMNNTYLILAAEQEHIVHPAALGLTALTKDTMEQGYFAEFEVKDYQLLLKCITLSSNNAVATPFTDPDRTYYLEDFKVSYNGAIMIGTKRVKDYKFKDIEGPCFSYQKVYELVFEKGKLITTIDQSKAMLRIRKNIELGLRSLCKQSDQRCIERFIHSSMVGDYRPFLLKQSRYRYLKEMKKDYDGKSFFKQIPSDVS